LTVTRKAERGFVWYCGRNSRFQDLGASRRTRRRFEFIRFSEWSVKTIRDGIEWKNT
jgi:hypothetical protein